MLNKLKNEIEACKFTSYNDIKIIGNELLISAGEYSGYQMLLEEDIIDKIIDKTIFKVQYLNSNIISVKKFK